MEFNFYTYIERQEELVYLFNYEDKRLTIVNGDLFRLLE